MKVICDSQQRPGILGMRWSMGKPYMAAIRGYVDAICDVLTPTPFTANCFLHHVEARPVCLTNSACGARQPAEKADTAFYAAAPSCCFS